MEGGKDSTSAATPMCDLQLGVASIRDGRAGNRSRTGLTLPSSSCFPGASPLGHSCMQGVGDGDIACCGINGVEVADLAVRAKTKYEDVSAKMYRREGEERV